MSQLTKLLTEAANLNAYVNTRWAFGTTDQQKCKLVRQAIDNHKCNRRQNYVQQMCVKK
jgi:hypothetical protein